MTTIAKRIQNLMTFYVMYSEQVDKVFTVAEEEKDDVRFMRDRYALWIKEELEALRELGIDVQGFGYIERTE